MNAAIDALIAALAAAPVASDACNEYAPNSETNAIRRANLRLYLQTMAARQPDTLLLMEAPGYRGCRLTGVPVTSRKILLEGVPELNLFGVQQGYARAEDPGFESVYGEQSATIVWGTLAQLQAVPLIWNTYPFHPMRPGVLLSNRAPRRDEIAQGLGFLEQVLALYRPARLLAVGNVAAGAFTSLGLPHQKIRHPAQGGKADFVAGLTRALA